MQIGSTQSGGNDTYTQPTSTMNEYETTYYWAVNVSDGTCFVNNTYCFTTMLEPASWWNTDWLYRMTVTINDSMVSGSDSLVNFPVLVDIIDSNLSKALSNGDDFVFTDYAGMLLHHEIEYFDQSSGHLVAWVNVTSLFHNQDTVLYLYYGNSESGSMQNPAGVWDDNYLAVWHLNETCAGNSGTHVDSTGNGNDGTTGGSVTTSASGQIDGADEFSGGTDHIDTSTINPDQITVEAWVKSDSFDSSHADILCNWYYADTNNQAFMLFYYGDNEKIEFWVRNSSGSIATVSGIFPPSTNTWYHLVGTYDGNITEFFIDGNSMGTDSYISGILGDSNANMYIGNRQGNIGFL